MAERDPRYFKVYQDGDDRELEEKIQQIVESGAAPGIDMQARESIEEIQRMIDSGEIGGGGGGAGIDEKAREDIQKVTTQLAEKANKNEVQSLVASKAEKTYVDQQVANKVEKTYVDQQISNVAAQGFPATNKVVNGNFKNGINSWSGSGATISVNNQVLTLTGSGVSTSTQILQTTLQDSIEGHILHIKFKATVRNSDVATLGFHLLGTTGAKYNVRTISKPQLDQVIQMDYRFTLDSSFTGKIKIAIFATYANNAASTGKKIEIENAFIHDLTETFGSGKEPTEERLDEIMSRYPNKWFDGTVGSFLSTKGIYDYFLTKIDSAPPTDHTFVDPNTGKTYSYYFAINPDGTVSIRYEEVV